jgi:glycolate oxidase FAD binding subunit
MKCSAEFVAQKLQAELGRDLVTIESDALRAHAVDDRVPAVVCAPGIPEQVVTVLRICAENSAVLTPWGGGIGMRVGNLHLEMCVAMDTAGLNRVVDHDHANLTVTAQSGIALSRLQEVLSGRQQFLPFDAPRPAQATVGGTVAMNLNGPRRGYYGGIRDLVIGVKAALITGEQIKSGGKVVKNVAGYDMCKLFTGSLGTLGVITEVTARVAPIPETAATILVGGSFGNVNGYAARLLSSPLLPVAIVLLNWPVPNADKKRWTVAVWCAGFEASVARHLADGQDLAQQLSVETGTLRGEDHDAFWQRVRDFPLEEGRCVYRAVVPLAAVGRMIEGVNQMAEPGPALLADMMSGVVWLSLPAIDEAVGIWPQLVSLAAAEGGHALMFSAPSKIKKGLDVWGRPPASLSLMSAIKRQFDPENLLNPGRFVGGI